MKKIIKKLGQAVQVVLLAPIKWPPKVMHVLKYIAVGLGIIEHVMDEGNAVADRKEESDQDAD